MGDDMGSIREKFEKNRRKFREEAVDKAWSDISEGRKTIPVEQFGSVCFKVDSSMNAAEVAKAVGEIDTDGDGTIDLGEFRAWYMTKLDADDEKAQKDREAVRVAASLFAELLLISSCLSAHFLAHFLLTILLFSDFYQGYGAEDEWDEIEMHRRMQVHMQRMGAFALTFRSNVDRAHVLLVYCSVCAPFLLTFCSPFRAETARIRRTFETIDEDGSGEIERGEFHRLVRRLAPQRSKEWINNQFDLADDGSGSLDFEEFVLWYESPEVREMRGEDQKEAAAKAKLDKLEAAVAEKNAARANRRMEFEEQTGAATQLQAALRGRTGRRKFKQARLEEDNRQDNAITKLQCAIRGRIARRQRTFAAIALAARAELQAKEDVAKLFWGDGANICLLVAGCGLLLVACGLLLAAWRSAC